MLLHVATPDTSFKGPPLLLYLFEGTLVLVGKQVETKIHFI